MLACSKINLVLNVISERENGYHDLDTVFFPLKNPSDAIEMVFRNETGDVTLDCSHPDVPLDPGKNLCGKAVYAYCESAGIPCPRTEIHIWKKIPCAGGMGGGSSDAAAVLQLMQTHFHLLDEKTLSEAALKLGADVPFFLVSRPARATGVGEKLTILSELPTELPILLAAPEFPVSAKWAYEHWTQDAALPADTSDKLIAALAAQNLAEAAKYMKNSLSAPVFHKFPVLACLQEEFIRQGALCSELSGSGPTVFAMFPDFESAAKAQAVMEQLFLSIRFISGFSTK